MHFKFSRVHAAFLEECTEAGVPGMEDVVFKRVREKYESTSFGLQFTKCGFLICSTYMKAFQFLY